MKLKSIFISAMVTLLTIAVVFSASYMVVAKPMQGGRVSKLQTLVSDTFMLCQLSQQQKADNTLSVAVSLEKTNGRDYSVFYLPDGTLKPEILSYIVSQQESNKQVSLEHLFAIIDSGEINTPPNESAQVPLDDDSKAPTNPTELIEITQEPQKETKPTQYDEVSLDALLAEIMGG